jgi:ribonuclease BN (tRNA processing enzyme)
MNGEQGPTRRHILRGAASLVGLASASVITRSIAQQAQTPAPEQTPPQAGPAGGARGGRGRNANSEDRVLPGTQVVLLGTRAGPGVDLKRAETCTAIVVDGTPYLVDCGYGAVRNMVAASISPARIEKMVFTHLHNDHTADLPALLTLQWTSGRTKPIDLYGPYDTEALVRAVIAYCEVDAGIRTVDEGRKTNPAELYRGHNVEATATPQEIFSDERVKVSTIENTHYPQHSRSQMPYRSIGVRFDTRTRSVVISGDTSYSKNLVKLARDVDVFVCEIMEQSVRDRWLAQLKENPDLANRASVSRHVSETHATPEDVGRMAAEANVKLVVLNHLLTSAGSTAPLAPLLEGVRKYYQGEVVLGEDLMMI